MSTLPRPVPVPGACAQYAGEDYDADDIINDGGTDDGGAEKALQVAQLLQVATVMDTLVAVMIVPMNRAR